MSGIHCHKGIGLGRLPVWLGLCWLSGLAGGWAGPFTPGNVVVARLVNPEGGGEARLGLVEFPAEGGLAVNEVALSVPGEGGKGSLGMVLPLKELPLGQLGLTPAGDGLVLAGVGEGGGGGMAVRVDGMGKVRLLVRCGDLFNGGAPGSVAVDVDGEICHLAGEPPGPSGGIREVRVAAGSGGGRQLAAGWGRQVSVVSDRAGRGFLLFSTPSRIWSAGEVPWSGEAPVALAFPEGYVGSQGLFAMLDRDPGVGAGGLGGLDTLYVAEEAQVRKYEWTPQGWTGRGAATYVPARGMAVRERDGRVEIHITGESGGTSLLARAVDDTPYGGTWHRLARDFTVLASSTSDRFLGVAHAPESLDLADLALEGVVLEPEFDGGRREYRGLTILGALRLRARTDAPGGMVEVREEGGAFGPLTAEARELRPGQNRFEVRVRSGNGMAGPVYRVEVGRLTPPEVGAAEVSRAPGPEVTVSAEVIADGGGEILERGIFCESPEGGTWIPAGGPPSIGKFSVVVSGLEAGRSYVFRGYARNRVGRQTGVEALFTTETFLSERLGVGRGKPRGGVEGSIAPFAVAVGGDGELFFADAFSHTIRKLTREGKVVVVAGSPGLPGGVDGEGAVARFHAPHGLAFGQDGALYVADTYNHAIRRISDGGRVSTHAGELGTSGARDGTAGSSRFSFPKGLVGDASGNLLVADTHNHVIRLVGNDGEVVTLAGKFRATGSADGTGSTARFEYPHGLALGQGGVVYVADSGNRMIRLLSADGTVTTVAGTAKAYGTADGKGGAARFANPRGVAVDGAGTVYVADASSRAIRMIAPDGMVGTLSFRPAAGGEGDRGGFSPHGIALDRSGVLYVADPANRCIRRIYRGVPGLAEGQR